MADRFPGGSGGGAGGAEAGPHVPSRRPSIPPAGIGPEEMPPTASNRRTHQTHQTHRTHRSQPEENTTTFTTDKTTITITPSNGGGITTKVITSIDEITLSRSRSSHSDHVGSHSSSQSSSSSSSSEISGGAIAGIVIGSIAGTIGIILLAWFCLSWRRKRKRDSNIRGRSELDARENKEKKGRGVYEAGGEPLAELETSEPPGELHGTPNFAAAVDEGGEKPMS